MGTLKSRREKAEWLWNKIEELFAKGADFIVLDALLAEFSYKFYSSERTGMIILKMFANLGKIKIRGNEILKK